ncbi:hypothetical protein C8Q72DRAFT_331174, partial [Fomitopsis betulina]
AGDFYRWRWSTLVVGDGIYCGDGWNKTLPESVQLAVCQEGVRLETFLYNIFWPDGSWNFPEFEEQALQMIASPPQPLSYCQSTTQNATTTLSSAHPTNTQSVVPAAATSISAGSDASVVGKMDTMVAAVGGALGGALGIVVIGVIVAFLLYRRRLRRLLAASMSESRDLSQNANTSNLTPFVGHYGTVLKSEHMPKLQTPPPRELNPSPSGYGVEGYGYGLPVVSSALSPAYGGMDSSELPVRERDTGRAPVSFSQPELPPDYRTVYSDN